MYLRNKNYSYTLNSEMVFYYVSIFTKDFKIERNQPGEDQKREPMFKCNTFWIPIFAYTYCIRVEIGTKHIIYSRSINE